MNVAAATVPVTTGSVTPPVAERVLAGVRTTVPNEELTATFPKFMLPALTIVIGVTMVAVAVAVAETCANVPAVNPKNKINSAKTLIIFFMVLFFDGLFLFLPGIRCQ